MNVKLKTVGVAAVFLFASQDLFAQQRRAKTDTVAKEKVLEEVVVLGYGKRTTKAKSTSASTTITSEVLENRPNTTFLNSLQGSAPGIQINSTSGSPGSGQINVRVRGLGSLNASTDPLYVIDGLATSGNQFRNLNPNDIESISVLRDAQATSIYGNRGANGVVVITTKSGRFNSGLRISYDALTSFSQLPDTDYNLADSRQLLTIQKNYGAGMGASLTQEQIDNYAINTDWNREFFRKGMTQQHNLGLRFGGNNISSFTSLGYMDNEGIIKGTDFQRFTFRNNLQGRSNNNRLTFNSQIAAGYSKRHQLDQETNAGIQNNVIQNPLFGPLLSPASLQPYPFVNGRDMYNAIKGSTSGRSAWILSDIIRGGIVNKFTETSILANVQANYKLTDYLTVGNKSGVDFKESDREFARHPDGYLSVNVAAGQQAEFGGFESLSNAKDFTFNSVTNLTFDQDFGDHQLTVSAYLDYIKGHYISKSQQQNGLNPLNWVLGAGTGYVPFNPATPNLYRPSVGASKINAGTLAYFGTLDYDYKGRYGFSGVVRRDGSYRFSEDNRWKTFWSVSGRWNIDREDFLRESTSVNMLKLRASYGTQGNQNLFIPANNANPLFVRPNIIRDVMPTNTGYQNLPGFGVTIANPDIKWEEQSQFNVGLDFGFFRNLVEGSFDYYIKKTTDLINGVSLSAATSLYSITGNNGEMENRGVEGNLRFNIVRKSDRRFTVFANTAYNKNKILSMDSEDLSGDNVNAIGGLAYQWHLYPYVGVNPQNGEQQFLDINGNVTEEPVASDRRLTGKSYLPKLTGGFGLEADVKGFYASALFTYQTGGYIYDNIFSWLMDPSTAVSYNASADLLNSWTPNNTNTNIPALAAVNSGVEGRSDRFLYKSDYLRLKNVALGFNFKKDQLNNLPINGMKVFVQAENIYTWTNWRGFDPEPIKSYSMGIYPNPKVFSVGFNVEF